MSMENSQCADKLRNRTILTTNEVCKLLRRSVASVRRYAKLGLIKQITFHGRTAGFEPDSVFALLKGEDEQ